VEAKALDTLFDTLTVALPDTRVQQSLNPKVQGSTPCASSIVETSILAIDCGCCRSIAVLSAFQ
jgi:hypothetical protein